MQTFLKLIGFLLMGTALSVTQAATIYPSPINEVTTRNFLFRQASEVGLLGSTSTTWYRSTAADPKGPWSSALQSSGTTLLCFSQADARQGACSATASNGASGGERDIQLEFVEQHSGVAFNLNLRAVKRQYFSAPPCDKTYPELLMDISARGAVNERCDGNVRDAASFKVYLPAMEINRLPIGGRWVATFHGRLVTRSGEEFPHVAQITLNIDDAGRHDIVFPEYPSGTPLIDLKFAKNASGAGLILSGQKNIDICLYDGYSLYSPGLIISFSGADASGFYLMNNNGHASLADKIQMFLRYYSSPDGWRQVNPNVNLDVKTTGPYTHVSLPGATVPIVCKNTQLEITVPAFLAVKKNSGLYRGVITVLLVIQ